VPQETDGRFSVRYDCAEQNNTERNVEERAVPYETVEADRFQQSRQDKGQQKGHDGEDQERRNEYAIDVEFGDHATYSAFAGSPA
jgi:hypothetical protein